MRLSNAKRELCACARRSQLLCDEYSDGACAFLRLSIRGGGPMGIEGHCDSPGLPVGIAHRRRNLRARWTSGGRSSNAGTPADTPSASQTGQCARCSRSLPGSDPPIEVHWCATSRGVVEVSITGMFQDEFSVGPLALSRHSNPPPGPSPRSWGEWSRFRNNHSRPSPRALRKRLGENGASSGGSSPPLIQSAR